MFHVNFVLLSNFFVVYFLLTLIVTWITTSVCLSWKPGDKNLPTLSLLSPALLEVSYEFCFVRPLFVRPTIHPSVRPSILSVATQNLRNWSSVFSNFLCEVRKSKLKKFCSSIFEKKVQTYQEGSQRHENALKMRLLVFRQKSNPFMCIFLFEYEIANGFFYSVQKPLVWEKIGSWVLL